jgi:glutaredoxin
MKPTRIALAAIAALLVIAAQAQTNVYRWVDKDGKVHFSDTPPPEDAKNATQRRFGGGAADDSQLPYATQQAMKRNPVTLFTGNDCGDPCARGRNLLNARGVPFSEKNAQANAADQEALKKLIGSLDVPLLVVGESKTRGYEESTWNSALDSAGYPRTRLPGQAPLRQPAPAAAPAPAKAPEPETTEPQQQPETAPQ